EGRAHHAGHRLARQEVVRVLEDVVVHRADPLAQLRDVLVALEELVDRAAHRHRGGVAVELLHALDLLLAHADAVAHDLLELLLERHQLFLDLLLAFLREHCEVLVGQHLAVADRREGEAVRRLDEADAFAHRFLVQVRQRLGVALGELRLDPLDLVRVTLGLEGGRDGRLQLLDQVAHVVAKLHAHARRQADRERPGRRGEVVDIDPVERLAALAAPADRLLDEAHLAARRRPRDEHVVAVRIDAERELDGAARALVADEQGAGRRVRRAVGRRAQGLVGPGHVGGVGAVREFFWSECGHRAPFGLSALAGGWFGLAAGRAFFFRDDTRRADPFPRPGPGLVERARNRLNPRLPGSATRGRVPAHPAYPHIE